MKKQSTHSTIDVANQGYCKTPWGIALLEYQSTTIYRFEFTTKQDVVIEPNSQAVSKHLIQDPKSFTLSPQGTDFQQAVWRALQQIPYGTLCSYADVAKMIGKPQSVRAVANAIGANPICVFIPCHRVIKSDGTLGGFSSGIPLKKKLLLEEGINPPSEGPSRG